MSNLSVIIPVYYSADTLMECYVDLKEKVFDVLVANGDDYELIMADDGSKDDSYALMKEIAQREPKAVLLKLSRNFGSHAAIYAGLNNASGDCATIKAADCQEPSSLILDMFESWKAGNKVVLAIRTDRDDTFSQKLFANLYYSLVRQFVGKNMPKGGFDCYLIDRNVIEALQALNEKNSALTLQILWTGFSTALVPYTRLARTKGKSRWTLKKKVNLVMDSFVGFSSIPIRAMSFIGVLAFIVSIIWALVLVYFRLSGVIPVEGWTMMMCMILFSTGLIMLSLAVLSEYIWRILDASRGRPVYIIDHQPEDSVV